MLYPPPVGSCDPCQTTTNCPSGRIAIDGDDWLFTVTRLTWNSPPADAPELVYRRANRPRRNPSCMKLVQAITKSPSASMATAGYCWKLGVYEWTWNSCPWRAPELANR
jgi:hypothetical protein